MSKRNRVIYANEALFISPTATGSQFLHGGIDVNNLGRGESLLRPIKRLQSINYSLGINRTPVYMFGKLGRCDTVVTSAPDVSLSFSYLLTDGKNEDLLGFATSGPANFLSEDFMKNPDGTLDNEKISAYKDCARYYYYKLSVEEKIPY